MKDFQQKEALISDCLQAIANYVCITWSENGAKMYSKKKVSELVFDILNK